MAYDAELVERVREQLAGVKKLSEKEMFGGLAFFVTGNMICSVRNDGLLARVRPDLHHDALTRPHVSEMEMGGRTMRGFVRVNTEGVADDAELGLWVKLGLTYAQSLPAKKAKAMKQKAPER
jgi:TfoX/Sxy family transcriptional regulator of competence genes